MPAYLLAYHGGSTPEGEEAQARSLDAWNEWMDSIADSLIDGGNPVGESRLLGAGGIVSDAPADRVTGYSVIVAADFEEAAQLATGCPVLAEGGSVEIAELLDMSAEDEDEDEDEDLDDEE